MGTHGVCVPERRVVLMVHDVVSLVELWHVQQAVHPVQYTQIEYCNRE